MVEPSDFYKGAVFQWSDGSKSRFKVDRVISKSINTASITYTYIDNGRLSYGPSTFNKKEMVRLTLITNFKHYTKLLWKQK